MNTLRELHKKACEFHTEKVVKEELRSFYKNLINKKEVMNKIINDLNKRTNSRFRKSSAALNRIITARMREGYKIEDFFRVNEVMTKKWIGTEFQRYLRPTTLYNGAKMAGYLSDFYRDEKEKQEKLKKKAKEILEQEIKAGTSNRTEFKKWYSFAGFEGLWRYRGLMSEQEVARFFVPAPLCDYFEYWLKYRLTQNVKMMEKVEQIFKEMKNKQLTKEAKEQQDGK